MVDGPLDMRMDQTTGQAAAAEILQRISEQELSELLFRYGEERYARRIARAIVRARARAPLRTTFDLVGVIGSAVPAFYRRGRIHFATRTFQALRIAVNRELDDLEQSFQQAAFLLRPEGRLCIVSFHSLEDRIAKRTLKKLADPESPFTLVTKKPIVPTEAERRINPRSRSAKLRILERVAAGRHT
jgi:16S rRNA (cytosine1402-N4)-methyltransferase